MYRYYPKLKTNNIFGNTTTQEGTAKLSALILAVFLHVAIALLLIEYNFTKSHNSLVLNNQDLIQIDLVSSAVFDTAANKVEETYRTTGREDETLSSFEESNEDIALKKSLNPDHLKKIMLSSESNSTVPEMSLPPVLESNRSKSAPPFTEEEQLDEILLSVGTAMACARQKHDSCDARIDYVLEGYRVQGFQQYWLSAQSISGEPSPYDNLNSKQILKELEEKIPLKRIQN